jgi:cyclic lactone autoinducer peptide
MNKITKICGNSLVGIAKKVTTVSANTACPFLLYQPKMPDSVKKLRKF